MVIDSEYYLKNYLKFAQSALYMIELIARRSLRQAERAALGEADIHNAERILLKPDSI